jgi:hypothetical protein
MNFSLGRDSHRDEIKLYHSSSMGERFPNVEVSFGFHFHLICVKLVIYKINLFYLPYVSADPAFSLNFLDYQL